MFGVCEVWGPPVSSPPCAYPRLLWLGVDQSPLPPPWPVHAQRMHSSALTPAGTRRGRAAFFIPGLPQGENTGFVHRVYNIILSLVFANSSLILLLLACLSLALTHLQTGWPKIDLARRHFTPAEPPFGGFTAKAPF